ncbi:MAG TPA: VOC family protein [Novosphingobium sp.]|nr:VOC family protein [Novosphingobium sp.]HZV08618.1 VOC family protein [Novosphingobium sp.]
MLDYTRAFHTGVLTPDLDAAIAFYARTLGLRFAEPVVLEALALWTPERGRHTVRNRFTYSLDGPLHLELQGGTPGSFYDPALSRGDHLGIWVDDLPATVARLGGAGWQVIAAGAAPEDGYGLFTYLQPAAGGMVIEIVSQALQPAFARWWAGGPLAV